jgi:hypothetical protein
MNAVIRTLGTLTAVALAGTALLAETAPTGRSNATAPVSAELAKTCRALAIKAHPTQLAGSSTASGQAQRDLFQRVHCQTRQHAELEPGRAVTGIGDRGRVTRSHVGFVP